MVELLPEPRPISLTSVPEAKTVVTAAVAAKPKAPTDGRATRGSARPAVLEVLRVLAPGKGLRTNEFYERVHALYPTLKPNTVRGTLNKLRAENIVIKDKAGWRLAPGRRNDDMLSFAQNLGIQGAS